MKKIIVEVQDGTHTSLEETVELHHLSDLGDGIKDAVDEFVKHNGGVVLPPVAINVTQPSVPSEQAPSA